MQGSTPTASTGPSNAANSQYGSNKYWYMEADQYTTGQIATLKSNLDSLSGKFRVGKLRPIPSFSYGKARDSAICKLREFVFQLFLLLSIPLGTGDISSLI